MGRRYRRWLCKHIAQVEEEERRGHTGTTIVVASSRAFGALVKRVLWLILTSYAGFIKIDYVYLNCIYCVRNYVHSFFIHLILKIPKIWKPAFCSNGWVLLLRRSIVWRYLFCKILFRLFSSCSTIIMPFPQATENAALSPGPLSEYPHSLMPPRKLSQPPHSKRNPTILCETRPIIVI
jgi:hypothetical protein